MCSKDFQTYFKYAHVCKCRDHYKFSNIRIEASESEKDYHLINMTAAGGETAISVSFKDKRLYGGKTKYNNANVKMYLAKKTDNGLIYIKDQNMCIQRDTYIECGSLEAGEYLIFVSIDWKGNPIPKEDRFFNVTSYGVNENKFEFIK